MSNRFPIAIFSALLCAALPHNASGQVSHTGNEVWVLHSPDSRPCVFFLLNGVAEADPVMPGNPWFGLPKSHPGYKEILTLLLIARTSGKEFNAVVTTGQVAQECGVPGVLKVLF